METWNKLKVHNALFMTRKRTYHLDEKKEQKKFFPLIELTVYIKFNCQNEWFSILLHGSH